MTSVRDCGRLLEQIYRGECVSEEASAAMLDLLLNQQVTWKIPEGLDSSVVVANKTGETDTSQHDMAIVYGEKQTTFSASCRKGAKKIQPLTMCGQFPGWYTII